MNTRRLFREDVYLKSCTAQITKILNLENKVYLALDRTIFFPTGGGQSCDTGKIHRYTVVDVLEKDDEILHQIVDFDSKLSIGDEVEISIDWDHRFDNMQRHCGEHILSGIFYELYGGVNRGFHMGQDYMTIDISLEENPAYDSISWEMAKSAELMANKVIWDNLPVITRHFDTRKEAEGLPLRKALAFDEDITIVSVGDTSKPADCVACCGTHPASAGQVGMIKIYKVEINKGMFRIFFESGQRAFLQYQARFDVLTTLENTLSAGFDDLMSKYQAWQEKNKAVRTELYNIKKFTIRNEILSLENDLANSFSENTIRYYEELTVDDLLAIGRALTDKIPRVLFLVHKPSHTVLLFSNGKIDCGKLVKDNAGIYNGKGGGNSISARALFTKNDYIDTFMDLIDKHLR